MTGNFAIGLVVYRPGPGLLERLRRWTGVGYTFYLYDNSPEVGTVRAAAGVNPNIRYYTSGKNAGLGIGISTLCAHAYYDGFKAMLFFDQDTGFSDETLTFISEFYAQREGALADYSALLFNARDAGGMAAVEREVRDVTLAINSGSLYLLDNARALGWHDHSYFVDGVDYKFCLDSERMGLKIGACSWTPGFDHVSEQDDKPYRVFGRELSMRAYPWFRVKDTMQSSVKLVGSALLSWNIRFAAKIMRLFIIYVLSQLLARWLDFVSGKNK